MRILGHIHTFNDEDVIDQSLQALLDQTYPVDGILIVDNGSTDGTLQRPFPEKVTIIRHHENLGTSGAVVTGFEHALANQYDWIYLLDADSAPCRDALEKLVNLYRSFPPELQAQTWLLASLPIDLATKQSCQGLRFTPRGAKPVLPNPTEQFYHCDATTWSGSLYKLTAVQRVGLPCADYVLDGGETAYGYQGKQCGYRAFMHQGSILDHNIDGRPGPCFRIANYRFGPLSFRLLELPPIRCYYVWRNNVYFWFYVYHRGNLVRYLLYAWRTTNSNQVIKLLLLSRWTELWACLRGLWDGLLKNMHSRY